MSSRGSSKSFAFLFNLVSSRSQSLEQNVAGRIFPGAHLQNVDQIFNCARPLQFGNERLQSVIVLRVNNLTQNVVEI